MRSHCLDNTYCIIWVCYYNPSWIVWSNVFKLYDLPLTNKKELVENSQIQLTKKLNLTTHCINHFAEPIDIEKLAVRYGTPLYIIDEGTLHKKVRELRNAYSRFNGHVKLAYSVKANFTPAVSNLIH